MTECTLNALAFLFSVVVVFCCCCFLLLLLFVVVFCCCCCLFFCCCSEIFFTCRGSHAGVCWVERRALSSLLPRTCTAVRSSRPSSPTPGSVRPRTSACRSCSCSTPATSWFGEDQLGDSWEGLTCKTGSRGGPSCTGQQGERPGNRTAGTSTGSTGPRTAQDPPSQKQLLPKMPKMPNGGIIH